MPACMPYGHSRFDIAMGRFLINSRGLQCYKRCLRSEIACSKGRSERAAQTDRLSSEMRNAVQPCGHYSFHSIERKHKATWNTKALGTK